MITQPIKIGIIGGFDSANASHIATVDALAQAAKSLSFDLKTEWLPTDTLQKDTTETSLKRFDGFWGAPGGPHKSMDGALKVIRFCRENEWPFLGT